MVTAKGICNISYVNLLLSRSNSFRKNKIVSNVLLQEFRNALPIYQQQRDYAMRLELTEYGIVWKRPDSIPSWRPEKSGDLAPLENIDKSMPVVSLRCIEKEIAKADKRVQDLLSVAFSSGKEILETAKIQMARKVQRHKYDTTSPEVKIARKTAEIRFFQQVIPKKPDNVRLRVRLQETIDNRNKRLRRLRQSDYKRFEWLLEELQIIYRPLPRDPEPVSRKSSLIKLVDMHCEKIIEAKLGKYQYELEAQQKPFLVEKMETLKWIAETEAKLGLPISVQIPSNDSKLLYLSANEVEHENKGSEIHKEAEVPLVSLPKLSKDVDNSGAKNPVDS